MLTSQVHATEYSVTPSPIIGYSPTDGAILGGALFYHPKNDGEKGRFVGLQLASNKHKDGMLTIDYRQPSLLGDWGYGLTASFSSFRYYDYGNGNDTSADNFQTIEGGGYQIRPQLNLGGFANSTFSPFIEYRGREEAAVDGSTTLQFSAETGRYAIGLGQVFDHRDDELNTTAGSYTAWEVAHLPEFDNNLATNQLTIEHRFFYSFKQVVSASRIASGIYDHDPGYLFRFNLGGEAGLRGFHGNRFSGDRYYLLQQEFRFPVWKVISGVVFAELGDVSYTALDNPRHVYGVGLRFALPPDFRMQLRFDLGFDDEGGSGLFVNFGHFI